VRARHPVQAQRTNFDVSPASGVERRVANARLEREEPASDVEISDDGLCQSYGIFGQPGCGKTYLLKQLLDQILKHPSKFGGLILDPKAALLGDIQEAMKRAGREPDLVVVNDLHLTKACQAINVIDAPVDSGGLGKALGLALKGSGITAKDPYWSNEVAAILGAALEVLAVLAKREKTKPTLAALADLLLNSFEEDGQFRPKLEISLADARVLAKKHGIEGELESARSCLQNYLTSKDSGTLRSFINQGFAHFTKQSFAVFSLRIPTSETGNLYDSTMENGKVIVVSVSKRNLAISRVLCTLVKTLFQQAVLTRYERFQAGVLRDYQRPLFFLVDEYGDVATDGELGDQLFFSQMRQFGCMGLVATQSIHMLSASALGENWKSLFSNMAAKIFMQLGDSETAEEATKLAGQSEFVVRTFDRSSSKDGVTQNTGFDLRSENALLTNVFLRLLGRGDAVVIGALDGQERPSVRFLNTGR